tara:strand:- start:229 stop:468 length:240 start_codon:yes stop_codon:yes gene_type:complete
MLDIRERNSCGRQGIFAHVSNGSVGSKQGRERYRFVQKFVRAQIETTLVRHVYSSRCLGRGDCATFSAIFQEEGEVGVS